VTEEKNSTSPFLPMNIISVILEGHVANGIGNWSCDVATAAVNVSTVAAIVWRRLQLSMHLAMCHCYKSIIRLVPLIPDLRRTAIDEAFATFTICGPQSQIIVVKSGCFGESSGILLFFDKKSRQITTLHLVLSGRAKQTRGQPVKCISWPHLADLQDATPSEIKCERYV
jgi:hypothetical protein